MFQILWKVCLDNQTDRTVHLSRPLPLAKLCKQNFGLAFENISSFLTQIWKACPRNIRNVHALIKLVTSCTVHEDTSRYIKRQLPLTIWLDRWQCTTVTAHKWEEFKECSFSISRQPRQLFLEQRKLYHQTTFKHCRMYAKSPSATGNRGRMSSALSVGIQVLHKNQAKSKWFVSLLMFI